MDNKYWNRGGEVVEPEKGKEDTLVFFGSYLASLPVIGSIDPSYPVGWVGDDVEMVYEIQNADKTYWGPCSPFVYNITNAENRRILFLPKEIGITSLAPDYTKEAEERIYPTYEQSGGGKNWDEMTELEQAYYNLRKAYNAFDVMKNTYLRVRQQSAAEIDRLRGEVERLKKLLKNEVLREFGGGDSVIAQTIIWQQFKTENNIQ